MTRPVSLAVIVIARNEERTIESCLRSCIEALRLAREKGLISSSKIVLVDSASTDRTRGIAVSLSVEVFAIPSNWPLSAAAGRFVGVRHTQSEALLFVDGDYVLEPAWLCVGLVELARPSVAGVCGVDREALDGRSAISRYVLEMTHRSVPESELVDTEAIPVGLYWRDWVERAGGIQPFLRGAEDRDLGIRVRALGGRMVKTHAMMGTHHWAPGEELNLTEYFRSVAKWSYGEGQAARFASGEPRVQRVYFSRYLHARHLLQLEEGLILCGWAIGVVSCFLLGELALAALLLGLATAGIALSTKARRERITDALFRLHAIPYAVIRLGSFGLGFLDRPATANEYPKDPPSRTT
jgi:hypothetical protein